jgi:hypothetical protein
MSRLVASLDGWRVEGAEWVGRLRHSVHLWMAVPLALVALTLTLCGFWVGTVIGGDGSAQAATRTIQLQGRVITSNGVQYVTTPARTVLVKGKRIRLAAQTVPLAAAGQTTQLPGRTVVVATTITDTSVGTVVRTVSVPVTVTGPTTTVTGPTTTVQDTITVPVTSTITVTVTGP